MGETVFFEIKFPVTARCTVDDRHEMEDRLDDALHHARLGEVTGGGIGLGSANIDVEVTDPQRGLALIREVLRSFAIAPSATIRQSGSPSIDHPVYERNA